MQVIAALVAGILFGAGLTVSQMVDPNRVLNFLDVAGVARGTWDPTLLMVFGGALATMFAAIRLQRRLVRPVLDAAFLIPTRTDIDWRLVGGSALFGIGWGLAGVCPGPALTGLSLAGSQIGNVALFVAAMAAGIMLSWRIGPAGRTAAQLSGGPATEPRS